MFMKVVDSSCRGAGARLCEQVVSMSTCVRPGVRRPDGWADRAAESGHLTRRHVRKWVRCALTGTSSSRVTYSRVIWPTTGASNQVNSFLTEQWHFLHLIYQEGAHDSTLLT